MNFDKIFKEYEKIVPFKKAMPLFVIMIIVIVIVILGTIISSKIPNRHFFNAELNGRVFEIESRPRDTYFLVGENWYLIKSEIIDKISPGDSINKPQDSYVIKVFDEESRVKWEGEVKSLTFRQVDGPK